MTDNKCGINQSINRNRHWLYTPYVKRVRKTGADRVPTNWWWCGQDRMSRTDVFTRRMQPNIEGSCKDIWARPDKYGGKGRRPTSIGKLLGESNWGSPLADWIAAKGVGFVGDLMREKEGERVERNDGWRREPFL
jgi:hypothetical protein